MSILVFLYRRNKSLKEMKEMQMRKEEHCYYVEKPWTKKGRFTHTISKRPYAVRIRRYSRFHRAG